MPCPKCGSKDRFQELVDPCVGCTRLEKRNGLDEFGKCWDCNLTTISFLVCRKCGFKEYDD